MKLDIDQNPKENLVVALFTLCVGMIMLIYSIQAAPVFLIIGAGFIIRYYLMQKNNKNESLIYNISIYILIALFVLLFIVYTLK